MSTTLLRSPSEHVPLAVPGLDETVRVWSIPIGAADTDADAWPLLDDRERARAARFRSEVHRRRYIARHAAYRRILGRYLGSDPRDVALGVTRAGRPELRGVSGIDFNTSHTDDLAIIAVAAERRVGVDIERIREIPDAAELAAAHFTGRERRLLSSTDPARRSAVFLAIWTAKEAVVKAIGLGLSVPLASFDTGLPDASGWDRVTCTVDGTVMRLLPLGIAPDHVATIALQGDRSDLQHLALSEAAV